MGCGQRRRRTCAPYYHKQGHNAQCGENCTGMRAMPVGKLSKTGKIKESYQNIYGQMSINVENP